MNILLFLTPKKNVAYLYDNYSLRQALEKMEYHRYSAIPIINKKGNYIGTLTEGDILWYLKNKKNLDIITSENENIMSIERHHDNKEVSANCSLKDIMEMAINQNFVPVVDDKNIFIGIITRKKIFQYLAKNKKMAL